jgi:hypothetical protein
MVLMPVDAIAGILLVFAAIIANAASDAGPNRVSILAVVLGVLGAYLVYNGYMGRPSYVRPWLPYF